MRYLARWRIQLAAHQLRNADIRMSHDHIGLSIGRHITRPHQHALGTRIA
jgi:hypothetical protein